jgi:hypothetical protein
MKPFRLAVQEALGNSLKEITPANGFMSNMADYDLDDVMTPRVFRGRAIYGDDDPVPMISILEEPIAPETDLEPAEGPGGTAPYQLMIQGFVPDDPLNPTDPAHVLLADVKLRLAQVREESRVTERVFQFGAKAPTVTGISFGGGVVRPADEISAKAYFWLRVTLSLVEDHDNPFVA